jgi:aminopeptidase N
MTSIREIQRIGNGLILVLMAQASRAGMASSGNGEWYENDGATACWHCRMEAAEALTTADLGDAINEATGRDLRHFPPDRLVDIRHMRLELQFADLNERRFEARETLEFEPVGLPLDAWVLDAVGLRISSVTMEGRPIEHFADGEHLTLRFDPPLAVGERRGVLIEYACEQPIDGMFFTPASPDAPEYHAEVHTQGQPESNRHWFVCHDSPNERMTTELVVTVPARLSVSSNGRLVSKFESSSSDTTWHYLQDKPHVAYLVSLVIGEFDIVKVPHDRIPMQVWVRPGLGGQVEQTYGRTGQMIDLFEQRFGIAYPWARYDQLTVKSFRAGGMENTSATSMYPTAILDETSLLDGDLDGLIAHELAHQWFGDLITCKSWAHIWLNEGWATYASALWSEQRDGRDGYLDSIRRSFGVARDDKTTNDLPMVSPIYRDPWQTFRRRANPYPKGASILHMLRCMLGDELFFKGVHLYVNRHAGGVVETHDLRYAMEEVSGLGLEWFFDQWCFRPGTPELKASVRYDAATRELLLELEQTQKIDTATPAFRFELPVFVRTSDGEQTFVVSVRDRSTSFRATLDGVPSIVAIDPDLHVLKTMTTGKPQGMWITQANEGPTIAARHEAIEVLGKADTPEVVELLAAIVTDESQRHTIRATAVDSLASLASQQARDRVISLAESQVADARVRDDLVRALRGFELDVVDELLADYARNDASYDVRIEAINALAALKAVGQADLIVELVPVPSQHDQVRQAALRALAALDDPRGFELAKQYSAYGMMDRSRAAAVECIGKLGRHQPDDACAYLISLLDDAEWRTAQAAARALAELGDERGVAPLQRLSQTHQDQRYRATVAELLASLNKTIAEEQQKAQADDETSAAGG